MTKTEILAKLDFFYDVHFRYLNCDRLITPALALIDVLPERAIESLDNICSIDGKTITFIWWKPCSSNPAYADTLRINVVEPNGFSVALTMWLESQQRISPLAFFQHDSPSFNYLELGKPGDTEFIAAVFRAYFRDITAKSYSRNDWDIREVEFVPSTSTQAELFTREGWKVSNYNPPPTRKPPQ